MKPRAFKAALLASALNVCSTGALAECPGVHVVPVESIPVAAAWALLDRQVQVSPNGQLTTVLWPYDQEYGRLHQKHGLDRAALLLAGAGDIDEQPLAVDIYCRRPCELFVEYPDVGVGVVWRRNLGEREAGGAEGKCEALKVLSVDGSPKLLHD